ncbi:bifunctional riboflavin kinase/FAD synthetase [uncultured Lentibacter sp.]|jgi:riboflavin kinase/FMN adenylyltransferase|uniref:bifunctional riboflavin kinase/FAD synthetase n=1 Tax=uncultured Lentibacter sp. TaxID=1659309 RepID=UPI00260CC78C|nr:bifunctional riboflavin kinase/FAD synthetase [uncultured Lentibacter sp.]
MRIIRSHNTQSPQERGAAVAIGNFDGVHRGHQSVIELAREAGKAIGAPLGVLTFEPHPRAYFAPKSAAFRLMSPEARQHRLEKLGVTHLYELPFDASLAALSPEAFARDVIHEGLGLSHVVIGEDFCFGRARAGTAEDMQRFGAAMGFGVTVAKLVATDTAQVSSTAIRTALSEGRPRDAAAMLGHWHRLEGPVEHGEKRGRELGFPTANMHLTGLHLPKFGVYAVEVDVLTGPHRGRYTGAASLGTRPMFGENTPNLETYIFDFKGDLYGETLSVALVNYLRPEETFESLEAFIAQMHTDCDNARRILSAL